MKSLAFSPAADADIGGRWDYTAEIWNAEQAERYTDQIPNICHALAAGTRKGRVVEIRPGI